MFIIFYLFVLTGIYSNSDFVNENLKSFVEFKLSNDISVVIKKTPKTETKALVLLLKGGATNVKPNQAGLSSASVGTALFESKKYSNIEKRKIMRKTSASVSVHADFTETIFYMSSLNKYFDEVFDLFSDLLINPVFKKDFFDEVITNMKNEYRQKMTNGMSRAADAIAKKYFKNHPYDSNKPDLKTLENFNFDDVKKYYKENFIASKMIIFAAGDFDIEKLKNQLELTFGKIIKGSYKKVNVPKFDNKREIPLVYDSYSELKEDCSYVICVMSAPSVADKDAWPLEIASELIKDLGFDIIRTEKSIVYSFLVNTKTAEASYSNIAGFRVNDVKKYKEALNETLNKVLMGYSAIKDDNNNYKKLSETLDFYKASFQAGYYDGLQTNSNIAESMAGSYALTGDYKYYLYAMDKINAITAQQVIDAAKKYIINNKKYCAISANPKVIEELKKEKLF